MDYSLSFCPLFIQFSSVLRKRVMESVQYKRTKNFPGPKIITSTKIIERHTTKAKGNYFLASNQYFIATNKKQFQQCLTGCKYLVAIIQLYLFGYKVLVAINQLQVFNCKHLVVIILLQVYNCKYLVSTTWLQVLGGKWQVSCFMYFVASILMQISVWLQVLVSSIQLQVSVYKRKDERSSNCYFDTFC